MKLGIVSRIIALLAAVALCFGVTANAAENRIITRDCSAKSGHYIEVEVRLCAEASLSSGDFTLEYDSSRAELKSVKKAFNDVVLRSSDSGSKTEISLICDNAVSLSGGARLFSVRYKRSDDKDFNITISADECIDDKGARIKGIKSAVCGVTLPYGRSASSGAASSSKTSSNTKSKTASVLVSSVAVDEDENDDVEIHYVGESRAEETDSGLMAYLPLVPVVVLFVLLCAVFIWNSVSRRKK